ncbi:trypsin-like serine protease [Streptomyces sp. PTM05]|uniref:Trypsin-like serine protease n=1 Tax=Streptantibioticus parmotrematis TaxID=2873249 RepID=A0ABS7QZ07_9ACTN|nr:trypsin-like serine protease [Streptantibioticus parmotrematis]MBY8887565.1 trypsin-like serine protease [Streptantibioticus parmotrematis]
MPYRWSSLRRSRLGRAVVQHLCRNSALTLSWLVLVAVGSTASAVALTDSSSSTGVSKEIHDTRSFAMVGAIFSGQVSSSGDHFCTGSVIDSPGRNLIVTAAHCMSDGTSALYFAPGYHDGVAPYGVWKLDHATTDSRWTSGQDPDHDVAFVTVDPLNGQQLESAVGSYTLGIGRSPDSIVRLTGYPKVEDAPLTCVNRASSFSATQLRIACTDYSGGTSGTAWVTGGTTVMGVIGGYEQGGDTSDVSYSVVFGDDVETLYQQATASA